MTRRPDPLPQLRAVAAALDAPGQPHAAFAALEQALGGAIGHRLFTIMRHDAAGGFNARIHSSRPAEYPLAGRKPVADTPWSRRVVREGRPWICRTPEDIERWLLQAAASPRPDELSRARLEKTIAAVQAGGFNPR